MKKIFAVTLAASLLFTSAAVYAADQQQYKDLKTTNWAYEAVKAMSDKDIIKGYPDGSFKPQSTVTYGEFIKMMVIAATGEELTVAEKPYHWAYNYYQKALELGLFAEAEIDTTMLNNAIPRSDMALIISNGLGKAEVEHYSEIEAIVKDVDSTIKYDYHIIKAYATGILSGYGDGSFKPKGTLTRAESALVIYRFTDESKRTPVTAETAKDNTNGKLKVVKAGKDLTEVLDDLKIIDNLFLVDEQDFDSYQIVVDTSLFQMKLKNKSGYYWIEMARIKDVLEVSEVTLITDGKVSPIFDELHHYDNTDGLFYKGDISTVDYILIAPYDGGTITLLENPFK